MLVKIILIDFDGVLSSYASGWQGADVIPDPPVEGAIDWLRMMRADPELDVQIYSSRSRQDGGVLAMKEWLIKHGMTAAEVDAIPFPTQKPPAFLTIDDRAICFKGNFMNLEPENMKNFQPWYSSWPVWKRYAEMEGAKFGIKVRLPPRPDGRSLVVYSDDDFQKIVKLSAEESWLHYSIIEPKVRFQVRVAAIEFEQQRCIKAGKKPRPYCSLHKCHHTPDEPPCDREMGLR